jgi:uncharacterized membrane protein YdjX (TVP38/TMEM64 family)
MTQQTKNDPEPKPEISPENTRPLPLWKRLWEVLFSMDAKAIRTVWVTLALFAMVIGVFLLGKTELGVAVTAEMDHLLQHYSHSKYALLVVVAIFTLSAFIGVPQFVLIAACVVAFGPWLGFFYSWFATIVSAAVTFYLGRFIGAETLNKIGGSSINRLNDYIGKNAFSASFIVRNVPSAPFIIVNMAFGVSKAPFSSFILGCALGSIPKTGLVAIFGTFFHKLIEGGDWKGTALIAVVGLIWLGLVIGVRALISRWRNGPKPVA